LLLEYVIYMNTNYENLFVKSKNRRIGPYGGMREKLFAFPRFQEFATETYRGQLHAGFADMPKQKLHLPTILLDIAPYGLEHGLVHLAKTIRPMRFIFRMPYHQIGQ
jgi:hypothetical protein